MHRQGRTATRYGHCPLPGEREKWQPWQQIRPVMWRGGDVSLLVHQLSSNCRHAGILKQYYYNNGAIGVQTS
mgnify:FL=1